MENQEPDLLQKAEQYFKAGRYAKACRIYERLLAQGLSAEMLCQLGRALAARERWEPAAARLEEALKGGWDRPELRHDLGRAYAGQNRHDEAIAQYQKAVQADARCVPALLELCKARAAKGNRDEALSWLEKAFQVDPARAVGAEGAGAILGQIENREEALAKLQGRVDAAPAPDVRAAWSGTLEGLDRTDQAVEQSMRALGDAPGASNAHERLRGLLISGKVAEAHQDELLGKVQSAVDQKGEAAAHLLWGETLRLLGRHEAAIKELEQALSGETAAAAHVQLAEAMSALERFDEAAAHFLKALQLGCGDVFWGELYAALMRSSEPSRWIGSLLAILEDVLRADAGARWAHQGLRGLAERGHVDGEMLKRVEALAKSSQSAAAHLEWGRLLAALGQNREALAWLEEAAKMDPEDPKAPHRAAALWRTLGQHETAMEWCVRAVEAEPAFEPAYRDWAGALKVLEQADGAGARLAAVLGAPEGVVSSFFRHVGMRLSAALGAPGPEVPQTVNWEEIHRAGVRRAEWSERLAAAVEANCDRRVWQVYLDCGAELWRLGQHEQARRLFEAAARLNPQSHEALLDWGLALARLGDHQTALQKLDQAIKLKPDYFNALVARARSLSALQRYGEADKAFAEALQRGTSVEEQTRLDAYNDWAFALSEGKQYERALETCRRALAKKADNYWSHFRKAYTLADMMLYQQAQEDYEKAVAIDPEDPYAHHNIAALWNSQGLYRSSREKWKSTRELYQKRLGQALRNGDADYCGYYGLVREDVLREFDWGEILFRAGLALNPDHARLHISLAKLCRERCKLAKTAPRKKQSRDGPEQDAATLDHWTALESYRHAVRILERRLSFYRDSNTLKELGELQMLMDEPEKAQKSFEEALKLDGESARGHKGLGESLLRQGKPKEAVRPLERSLGLDRDNLAVRAALAQAHLRTGTLEALEAAETEYRRVLDATRHHTDSLLGLGEVYLEMAAKRGDKDTAVREELYTQAIERLSEAISVSESADRPITSEFSPASAYYLRGYARVQLYETSRLGRDEWQVREARRDFLQCMKLDREHHKAARAVQRIQEKALGVRSRLERMVPAVVVTLSLLVFAVAQVGLAVGVPTRGERIVLTAESLKAAGVAEDVAQALKPLEQVRFRSDEQLVARMKSVLGDKRLEAVKGPVLEQAARTEAAWEFVRLDTGTYALLAFGALLFLIAGAYLPQLTTLKVGALQIDKSTAERVETVRSLGIPK
ncbi:MAG: tetratricopeptide repeat protein [Acidobacteria bacterium]|nr:tetratricopeptide repeat protein [Acidobacteriota bacterium]